jgi:hypothetical protein
MKEYWSTHNTCTNYIQNASITYYELIKKDPTCLLTSTYLFTYAYLPTYTFRLPRLKLLILATLVL